MAAQPPYALTVPYRLGIKIDLFGHDDVGEIVSPSHEISLKRCEDHVEIGLAQGTTLLDRDFILNITHRNLQPCKAFLCEYKGQPYLQIDFTATGTTASQAAGVIGREIVFLLDCSGSMAGSSIEQAKQALEVMLRALDGEIFFNLCCFGSSFGKLFEDSRRYDKKTLRAALKDLSTIDAEMGGTEILTPLEDILI
jgi:Ca-activated chloride channel family protein